MLISQDRRGERKNTFGSFRCIKKMEQENTNAKMFSSQFPWEKKVIIQSRRDTDETGQIDRIALISCFGAVSCDERHVNSLLIYAKPLQDIQGYGQKTSQP